MTHTLDELDELDDVPDLDDPHDHEPAPAPRRVSRPEQARRHTRHDRSATRDALCELVRHALGAKIGHDVDRLDVALDHLATIAANLDNLRTALTTEQTTDTRQDDQP
jgi:hypothetical protein